MQGRQGELQQSFAQAAGKQVVALLPTKPLWLLRCWYCRQGRSTAAVGLLVLAFPSQLPRAGVVGCYAHKLLNLENKTTHTHPERKKTHKTSRGWQNGRLSHEALLRRPASHNPTPQAVPRAAPCGCFPPPPLPLFPLSLCCLLLLMSCVLQAQQKTGCRQSTFCLPWETWVVPVQSYPVESWPRRVGPFWGNTYHLQLYVTVHLERIKLRRQNTLKSFNSSSP